MFTIMFSRNVSNDTRQNTIINSELQVKMMYAFFNKIQIPVSNLCQLETLIPKMNPGDKIYKYAEALNTCGTMMSSIITNLKLFYQLKMGIYDKEKDVIVLRTEIMKIWKKFIVDYNINDICNSSSEIQCDILISKDVPQELVYIDMKLLEYIINTLIENAYIYTHDGYLKLSISSIKTDECEDKEYVMNIIIEDSGEGIPHNIREDVFEPFSKNSVNSVGPGLGLPVSRAACKQMNGGVEIIDSEVGKGTKIRAFFKFSTATSIPIFPVRDMESSHIKVKKNNDYTFQEKLLKNHEKQDSEDGSNRDDRDPTTDNRKKILVVEDSKIIHMLITSFLRGDKFVVQPAYSGKNAIELCKETKYDVILMDINMPVMNGFTAINRIKEKCYINFNTPIVCMSGTNIDDIGFLHHTSSPIHFLTKPITKAILIRVLSKYTEP